MEFPDRDWVDGPRVGCGGFDIVSEVVAGAVVSGAATSGFLISEVVVSDVAVSEFAFSNSVSSGVLSPKQKNHFLFHLAPIFQTLTQI